VVPPISRTTSARGTPASTAIPASVVGRGHGLGGDVEIQAVAGDELVDDVEVGGGLAVQLGDLTVAHHQRGLRVMRAVHRDQAQSRVGDAETVEVDRFCVENPHAPEGQVIAIRHGTILREYGYLV
jgi:hypothetical protein